MGVPFGAPSGHGVPAAPHNLFFKILYSGLMNDLVTFLNQKNMS